MRGEVNQSISDHQSPGGFVKVGHLTLPGAGKGNGRKFRHIPGDSALGLPGEGRAGPVMVPVGADDVDG